MSWTYMNQGLDYAIDQQLSLPPLCDLLKSQLDDDAFVLLNVCVNNLRYKNLPQGKKLYVLGFWAEVFDDDWFRTQYEINSESEFLILTDLSANDLEQLPRVNVIRMLHWQWFIKDLPARKKIDWQKKQRYKISSLSGRITEFRWFITAALIDKPDVLLRWNKTNEGNESIFRPAGWPLRDRLLCKKHQLEQTINAESVPRDPEIALRDIESNPAYAQTLINVINETKDLSKGNSPGPYLTEKTWKPMIAGNALIFTGQRGIADTLTKAGLKFQYPWSNDYDNIMGDLERLDSVIALLDKILGLDHCTIQQGIKDSVEHNHDWIYGTGLRKYISDANETGMEKLERFFR